MKTFLVTAALGAGFLLSAGAYAQAPAGATASCKDGTYFTGTTHKGACRGHKGVKEWLDKSAAAPAASAAPAAASDTAAPAKKSKKSKKAAAAEAAAAPAAAAPAPVPAPMPAPKAAPSAAMPAAAAPAAATSAKHTAPTPASQIAQKPGGGPGLVWVNSSSKVYHCQGDEWYGKTKEGSYMTEAAATAAGNHGDHGKACSK